MTTITKKDLIDRISQRSRHKRSVVKQVIQQFLDEIVEELGEGNRLEFRDFGVFESRIRASRMAQNPKTLERVYVQAKRTVKFKIGRMMRRRLADSAPPAKAAGQGSAGVARSEPMATERMTQQMSPPM